jgi:HK97 family phage prohead protease
MYKKRACAFLEKSVDSDGSFGGYLSVFDNADSYRDVVRKGAFQDSLNEWGLKGALPPVLWQHQSGQPIGPFTKMEEDNKGLKVEGRLLINDVPKAKEAHALLKHGVIRGMSIGYDVDDEKWDGKLMINELKKLNLWEGSLVTFPANDEAMVTEVKALLEKGNLPTIRQFESLLREAGYSRKMATDIATGGYVPLLAREARGETEHDGKSALTDRMLSVIDNFKL